MRIATIASLVLLVWTFSLDAQDLRKNGSVFGRIEKNGDVRIRGRVVGRFEKNGDIRVKGAVRGRLRVTEPVIKFITVRIDEEQKRLDKVKKIRASRQKRAPEPAATEAPAGGEAAPAAV